MSDVEVRDTEYYMEHQEEYEALTEDQQAELILHGHVQGDTKAVTGDQTKEDAATPGAEAKVDEATKNDELVAKAEEKPAADNADGEGDEKVIASKDGKHTIPYSELQSARDSEKHWKDIATQQATLLETLNKAKESDKKDGTTDAQDKVLEDFKEEYPDLFPKLGPLIDSLVSKGVSAQVAALEAKLEGVIKPLQSNAELTASEKHFKAITDVHADAAELVEKPEFKNWIDKLPSFAQAGAKEVLEKGTAAQVNDLFTAYKTANPTKATENKEELSKEKLAAKAKESIEKSKTATPTSLSDVPGSTQVNHDELEAMLEQSPAALLQSLSGKTPAQIEAILAKQL